MVDFLKFRTFPKSYWSHDNFLCIKQFILLEMVLKYDLLPISKLTKKKIIMIKHLEVTSNYLLNLKHRN